MSTHAGITERPLIADLAVEQIAAMHIKALKRREAPYADSFVLPPFGRRMQRQLKQGNLLWPDGAWKTVKVQQLPILAGWAVRRVLHCWATTGVVRI